MKLFRFGPPGKERPGVLNKENEYRDISRFGEDFDEEFFGSRGMARLDQWMQEHPEDCPECPPIERFGPPVKRPSKIVCIGLNYADHAIESNMQIPPEPVIFF